MTAGNRAKGYASVPESEQLPRSPPSPVYPFYPERNLAIAIGATMVAVLIIMALVIVVFTMPGQRVATVQVTVHNTQSVVKRCVVECFDANKSASESGLLGFTRVYLQGGDSISLPVTCEWRNADSLVVEVKLVDDFAPVTYDSTYVNLSDGFFAVITLTI